MIFRNLLFSLFGLVIAVLVAEAVARNFYTGLIMTGTIMTNDPELAFTHKKGASVDLITGEFKNHFAIDNEIGVRVANAGDLPPYSPNYIIFGDSMAFGYGVEFNEVFSEILNSRFGAGTFLNAGTYSYGPDQEYILSKRLRGKINAEKEIVLFYTGNDFENFEQYFDTKVSEDGTISFTKVSDEGGKLRRTITNLPFYPLLCRLYLYHWARAVFLKGGTTTPPLSKRFPNYPLEELPKDVYSKVIRIAALFEAWSKEVGHDDFYLIIVPHQQSLMLKDMRVSLLEGKLKGKVQVFNYFDFLSDAEKNQFSDLFYPVDAHWNITGHQVTADVVARILQLND